MKKHLPLIIGLALPLLMIIFVAVSIYLPTVLAKPAYSFVYSVKDYYDPYGIKYHTVNGTLVQETIPYPTSTDPYRYYPTGKYPESKTYLYMFDVKTQTAKEVTFDEAKTLKLIDSKESPDGYTLGQGTRNAGIFEIFGGYNGDYYQWYLKKGAVNKKIKLLFPTSSQNYYYNDNFNFLGWVQQ